MKKEDLQQISDLLDKKLDKKLNPKFAEIDKRFNKLEKWQDSILDSLVDFRQEVKDDQEYTHKRIDQGFKNISEQMVSIQSNKRRITNLERKSY